MEESKKRDHGETLRSHLRSLDYNKQTLRWYAYRHIDGGIFLKRFFNMGDLAEASESPFVEKVMGPFNAPDKESAVRHAQSILQR